MLCQIAHIKAALWVNSFFYYFKRLWLVGRLVPDTVYGEYELKKALTIAAFCLRQGAALTGKLLYLLGFVGLPLFLFADGGMAAAGLRENGMGALVQILFFLSCVLGAFENTEIFEVTRDKLVFIKYMRVGARRYLQAYLVLQYVPFFLYFLIWLIPASLLLGGTAGQGLGLWLLLLAFRMAGEAFQLLVFDRTGKVLSRSMAYDWLLILVGFAGAYLPLLTGDGWSFGAVLAAVLAQPLFWLAAFVVAVLCGRFVFTGYKGYDKKYPRAVDQRFLASSMMKNSSSQNLVKDVEIKEKDGALSVRDDALLGKLHGYAYFNALFFARHRRQLLRPVYYRLAAAAIGFGCCAAFCLLAPDEAGVAARSLTRALPFFVYIMFFMTVADKASRAMFYNCDKDMLRYAYYRQPRAILHNFRIRLVRVALYDLAIGAAVALAACGFCLLAGAGLRQADLWLFNLSILLLSLCFTVHHLCLYYLFQPYAVSMQIKNPLYTVVNLVVYFICFFCLQIDAGGLLFTLGTLAVTVLYTVCALVLVYLRAPKTFRVK